MNFLPKRITPKAPPIKTQGIKTKLVPMIAASISWPGEGRWVEPFVGSGAVALNLAPPKALLADTNKHIIGFYKAIQSGQINGAVARRFLEAEGNELRRTEGAHFYVVRKRFNEAGDPLDFLFLSRACFNGVMRFNKKGGFNVPFCKKPDRFRQALVTKVSNQIDWAAQQMRGKDWMFVVSTWQETLKAVCPNDMVYCDPPYVGRHTDYFNSFGDPEAAEMAKVLLEGEVPFALSMWLENKYRRNDYVDIWFSSFPKVENSHFYHVGASEELRSAMTEVLILSPELLTNDSATERNAHAGLPLFEEPERANV